MCWAGEAPIVESRGAGGMVTLKGQLEALGPDSWKEV